MLKLWMVVCLLGVGIVCVYGDKKNYNGDEHVLLCKVLKAAVFSYKSNSGSKDLKRALHITIFGSEDGGDLETLKGTLSGDYDVPNGRNRASVCGQPHNGVSRTGKPPRWPGHSAPHDLLCLCTPGQEWWPLSIGNEMKELCGESKGTLKADTVEGWGTISGPSGAVKGKEILTATWNTVTKKCLDNDGQGGDLKDALKKFIAKLNHTKDSEHENKYRLGDGDFESYTCSGNKKVCVMYYKNTDPMKPKYPMPWWTELENAIEKDDAQEEKNKKEEEKRNKEAVQNNLKVQNQQTSQPQQTPRVATVKPAAPEKLEERQNTQNISAPLATIEDTSRTLIIPPCSWLLSALLLI
ncbi:Variant surface glycoprotein [Trypanosoma congolense IL3000]|uniref:Variant surface glycoprotein n=1 Tax=Trypanosoma congolense (strain IL3000) TaxID=1068625 RepID=F9WI35_TRYCI|nr:Variant surface glycoprotein [Trypanosoma congolense IL3000]